MKHIIVINEYLVGVLVDKSGWQVAEGESSFVNQNHDDSAFNEALSCYCHVLRGTRSCIIVGHAFRRFRHLSADLYCLWLNPLSICSLSVTISETSSPSFLQMQPFPFKHESLYTNNMGALWKNQRAKSFAYFSLGIVRFLFIFPWAVRRFSYSHRTSLGFVLGLPLADQQSLLLLGKLSVPFLCNKTALCLSFTHIIL